MSKKPICATNVQSKSFGRHITPQAVEMFSDRIIETSPVTSQVEREVGERGELRHKAMISILNLARQ